MLQKHVTIEHAAPWLVSSVSGLYVMARARRLSLAKASKESLSHFLVHQSDLILMLCGGPTIWYIARVRRGTAAREIVRGANAQAVHQLRQVFTALLLGTGLLMRKAAAGKAADLPALAQRLNKVVHDGIAVLTTLGEPYPSDLLDEHGAPNSHAVFGNGVHP